MFGKNADKPASSGMEMMLRSMGMGPLLDMGLQLANDGTLGKIVAFAEQGEEILKTLKAVQSELEKLNRGRIAGSHIGGAGTFDFKACPHCGAGPHDGTSVCLTCGLAPTLLEGRSSNGHQHSGGNGGAGAPLPATDSGATNSV